MVKGVLWCDFRPNLREPPPLPPPFFLFPKIGHTNRPFITAKPHTWSSSSSSFKTAHRLERNNKHKKKMQLHQPTSPSIVKTIANPLLPLQPKLTCRYVSPRNSGSRRSISAKMHPTLQMSMGYPYSAASMISGDRYQRVTTYSVSSAASSSSGELTPLERPKSHSFRSQFCHVAHRREGGGWRGRGRGTRD